MASSAVLKAIAVTVELCGANLSPAAAAVLADDLSRYPENQVMGALNRCRKELRPGQFNVAAVIERLDDGRPGAEEAWAMIPRDEAASVVWTEEMREGWASAGPLIREGDIVPARMAFLETYRRALLRAREAGTAIRWTASLGHDLRGRENALIEAVSRGRLTHEQAFPLLPQMDGDAAARLSRAPALPAPKADPERRINARTILKPLRADAQRTAFERLCDTATPHTLSWLARNPGRDSERILRRFFDAGVVSDDGKIVPKEERAALAAQRASAEQQRRAETVADLPETEPTFE